MARTFGRLAVRRQRALDFGADLFRAGEQDGRVEVALQRDLVAHLRARAAQVHGPVEADRVGASIAGSPEHLANALLKIEAYAKRVPMNVNPAQASAYIAYVSNEKANTVSVIDTENWTVTKTIKVGQRPRGIEFTRDGGSYRISSRPSDAIALAVRYGEPVPIFAHEDVLEEAGVLFEQDEDEEQIEQFREFLDQVRPEDFAHGE